MLKRLTFLTFTVLLPFSATFGCPSVTADAGPDQHKLRGQVVTLNGSNSTPSNGLSYEWDFGNGVKKSGKIVEVRWCRLGSPHTVTLRVSMDGVEDTDTVNIWIEERDWNKFVQFSPDHPDLQWDGDGHQPPTNSEECGKHEGWVPDGWFITEYQISDGGPDNGYWYVTGLYNLYFFSKGYVNADITNHNSEFARNQGDPGEITIEELDTQTRRHEYNHHSQSHHAFWCQAELTKGDMGMNAEDEIQSGGTQNGFHNSVTQKLSSQLQDIFEEYENLGEPYPINCDENGNFLGNIDYPPYN